MSVERAAKKRRRRRSGLRGRWAMPLGGLVLSCASGVGGPRELHPPRTGASPEQAAAPAELATTSLTSPECLLLDVREQAGESIQRCPGVAGYQLFVLDEDSRMSITVATPEGERRPLDFEQAVSPHFTTIGPSARWRIQVRAVALAVPVLVNEDPDHPDDVTKYWAIARLTTGEACVTERLQAREDELKQVDVALAAAAGRPCLLAR